VRRHLAERLETSPAIFALLRALDDQTRRVWLWLWDAGGSAPLATVQSAFGLTLREMGHLVPQLETQALAFDTLTPSGARALFLPTLLYQQLQPDVHAWRAEVEAHTWLPLERPGTPDVSEGTPTVCYDLAVLVGWVYQTTLEPTNAGPLPKRLRAQIRPRLGGLPRLDDFGQDVYPDLLLQAATDLRLVQLVTPPAEGARPRYAPGPALASWGQAGLDAQASHFLAWWQASRTWQDLLPDQRSLPAYHWTEEDRAQVIEHLRRCAAGRWYPISSLLYALWQQAPLDLSFSQRSDTLSPFDALQTLHTRWMERAGQRALGMLTSTLAELGLVELAGETNQPLPGQAAEARAVRLTDLGVRLLGDAPPADQATSAPARPPLIVQPSFEVVCLQTHLPLLYTLLPWAEVTQIGRASTLRLTKASLLRGLAHGGTAEDLVRLLEDLSGQGLPQNIDYSLREWARGYQGTTLAQVFLLRATSRDVAQQIIQVLAEHRIQVQPLTDCLLAIESHLVREGIVYRHLEQAGIVVQRGIPPSSTRV
jgi:hypothetical protein